MSVVISSDVALSADENVNADNPLIGWQNLITTSNIASTTAALGFPVTNLANPSTNLRWKGTDDESDEYITITLNVAEDVDYIAVARHNFGSAEIAVSVEIEDDTDSVTVWDEVITPTLLPNDGPALFRFDPQGITKIRLRLQLGTEVPTAAVVYVGKLLIVQRRIYVGHTPIPYGRVTEVANGRAEAGHYLGRIVTRETTETGVDLRNLTPAWYRANMEPFLKQAQAAPFFFAWRPGTYPREVGYAWLMNDPQPVNQLPNGMMQVELQMSGAV